MPDRREYTVGWICAIPVELVAAKLFLDERHGKVDDQPLEDNNIYTLGKIGDHNVVVASLPDGEYGTEVAGTVARDLLRSFPNVKVGLMVGIGGGVPSAKHDIRLGDVVVSSTRNGEPGVFQYDFGKTIQDGAFQHTRFLDQTPRLLRSAVAEVKSEYDIVGHKFNSTIDGILEKNRKVRKTHKRPPESTDRLYISNFVHPPDGTECEESCGDDKSVLKIRLPRDEDEDDPAIHYGLIASGNSLMKDAKTRDQLAEAKDVLCFEMEAAGLMNHFPCLVIRGICDYADSHKKKGWQGYAAMTAAAYAKDVLKCIPTRQVQLETPIAHALGVLANDVSSILDETHERDRRNILDWITLKDYGPEHSDRLEQRERGTGQWFLDLKIFKAWFKSNSQTLFCPGIPGAGKTILASIVIEHIGSNLRDEPDASLAYIYFDHKQKDQHNARALLASLLKQLAATHSALPETVHKLYETHCDRRTRPSADEYTRCLRDMVHTRSKVFIVLDALDECTSGSDEGEDRPLHKFLDVIFQLQVTRNVSLLATSRFIPDISKRFDAAQVQEIRASSDDITNYVSTQVKQIGGKIEGDDELQAAIKKTIIEAVDGMFLMARLYIQSLRACMMTKRKVKEALERFARQEFASDTNRTHHAYDEAVLRIDSQNKEYRMIARQALLWITYAERPLTTDELIHALAVERSTRSFVKDNMARIEDVASVCAGLVAIDDRSGIVRLVHHTAYEYFLGARPDWIQEAHSTITSLCVAYLSYEIFASDFEDPYELRRWTDSHCLYSYAATYWGRHACKAGTSTVDSRMMKFLGNARQVKVSWEALLETEDTDDRCPRLHRYGNNEIMGIHLASYFGIQEAVRHLLVNGANVDNDDGDGWTPFSYAAYGGQSLMIQYLLNTDYGRPEEVIEQALAQALTVAVKYEQEGAALTLLRRGGHICSDKDSPYLVYYAVLHEMYAVLANLLSLGADPNMVGVGDDALFPLGVAASSGCDRIVKLLLQRGCQINACQGRWGTAVNQAAQSGQKRTVELLLDHGADIELGYRGETPLMSAAMLGYLETAQLLFERKANIEAVPVVADEGTPLSRAAAEGHTDVAQFLLDCGASIERPNIAGCTPLLFAAGSRYINGVQLLLEGGANIQATDYYGRSPLHRAAEEGCEANMQLLIENGASLEATDSQNSTPLHKAVESQRAAAIQLLLSRGADVDAVDDRLCGTSLCWASYGHGRSLMQMLIEGKADVDVTDCCRNTPLMCALCRLSMSTLPLLSQKHAPPPPNCRLGELKMMKVFRLLLHSGADVNIKNSLGNTALHIAAHAGHKEAVMELIQSGADINARNDLGETALYTAGLEFAKFPEHFSSVWTWLRDSGSSLCSSSDWDCDESSETSESRDSCHSEASYVSLHDSVVSFSNGEVRAYCPGSDQAAYGMSGTRSPLHPWRRSLEVLDCLLAKGANVEMADNTGATLLWRLASAGKSNFFRPDSVYYHAAFEVDWHVYEESLYKGSLEIVKLLLTYKAEIETADGKGRTPLWVAADSGETEIVRLLLDHGANSEVTNARGQTPLHVAVMRGYDDVDWILSWRGSSNASCVGIQRLFSEADDPSQSPRF